MITRLIALLLLIIASPAARAQFQLFLVNGNVEQATGPIYAFGSLDTGDVASAQFRIRNTSASAATLGLLALSGSGFALSAPATPVQLNSQASIDFSVSFRGAVPGAYSGALDSVGISLLLTATALPRLTYQLNAVNGPHTLGPAPVDFGSVPLSSSAFLSFTVVNQTTQPVTVPALSIVGADFAFVGPFPAGTLLQPQETATFGIVFHPAAAGVHTGTLTAGTHTFGLSGTGKAPQLPKATLSIDLPTVASDQQGKLTVILDAPSPATAQGTITLGFEPAASGAVDSAIAFSSDTPAVTFSVAEGDTQASFASASSAFFQTGTTAGTLSFTVQWGDATSRQDVVLPPALIGVSSVQGSRQSNTLTVQVIGFDNTLTASKLVFTFYDSAGNAIAPGAITADAAGSFSSYFVDSNLGGTFAFTAIFPVSVAPSSTSDRPSSLVSSFDVQLTNSSGISRTARTAF